MTDAVHTTQRAALQAVADRMVTAGVCSAPLYAAAAAGQIALIQITDPTVPWPAETIETVTQLDRPVVVLLSGDPGWGQPSFGPGRWRCAPKLRAWAASAIIHGAGGEPDHYHMAIGMAVLTGRLVLIETTSGLVRTWHASLSPVPSICFLPPDGGAHPIAPTVRH